jgi:y4mF family transcriptional regulator
MTKISNFIKHNRKKNNWTQLGLAKKAGVGIRFVQDIERGKQTIRLDKLEQVMNQFNREMAPQIKQVDPFHILWNYFNLPIVIINLLDQQKVGFIVNEHFDTDDSNITHWDFVSNNNAKEYKATEDQKLLDKLPHSSIKSIDFQPLYKDLIERSRFMHQNR